jgi:hypothetical protein
MQQQAHIIAQRLLNLYRQEHVINGGWAAVNPVLIAESDDPQVIEELKKLPTGKRLATHIENLRSGVTPMDTIESELLPYGGLIASQEMRYSLTEEEMAKLKSALDSFETTPESLKSIKNLDCVSKFGADWVEAIKSVLAKDPEYLKKWDAVVRTSKAYQMWDSAKQLLSETLTERNRAQIQADMPEFETYLPMFGDQGKEMLSKLRTFMSSVS